LSNNADLEPCFLLHSRKYTDSKNIISLLTQNFGLVSAVFRVQKRKSIIQAPPSFTLFKVSWFGKQSLKTVSDWEVESAIVNLHQKALFCGIYVNELIVRLVKEGEEVAELFSAYSSAISKLSHDSLALHQLEVVLRIFELNLLRELGLEINMTLDLDEQPIIDNDVVFYQYVNEQGFQRIKNVSLDPIYTRQIFSGSQITNIVRKNWTAGSLQAAKRLTRLVFAPLLGDKPIKARELFSN